MAVRRATPHGHYPHSCMHTLLTRPLLLLCLMLAGCTLTPPMAEREERPQPQRDPREAVQHYLRLAEQAPPAQAAAHRLEAAAAMLVLREAERALSVLEAIDPRRLDPAQQTRLRLLLATARLDTNAAGKALETLRAPPPANTPPSAQARYHELRALAYARQGNHLESAREYMYRGHSLDTEAAVLDNQRLLWNALGMMTPQALRSVRVAAKPGEFSGWLALAELGKEYRVDRSQMERLLADWRRSYPGHPARSALLDTLLSRTTQLAAQPRRIALLLPLSGRFAAAGAAVRDGILAAYYSVPTEQRVALAIYDASTAATVGTVYDQAVADGADFVIGPLSKEDVAVLLTRHTLPVPTLALNNSDTTEVPANLYQFSLAPEEEAQQVAEQAWLAGHAEAAVIVPTGEWGERLERAFSERWRQLGGIITTGTRIDAAKSDYSDQLRALLNLDASDSRHRRLQAALGEKLHFEPRRRADVDFVFLAAAPRQARLLRPQLKFHHASDLPVLTTSHVYAGTLAPEQDRDMDGIVFCDTPWTLNATTPHQTLRREAVTALHLTDGSLQRLVAMGVDAYHLAPLLGLLETNRFERYPGETGLLRIEGTRRVHRQLSWARFVNGTPRLLETAPNLMP